MYNEATDVGKKREEEEVERGGGGAPRHEGFQALLNINLSKQV